MTKHEEVLRRIRKVQGWDSCKHQIVIYDAGEYVCMNCGKPMKIKRR